MFKDPVRTNGNMCSLVTSKTWCKVVLSELRSIFLVFPPENSRINVIVLPKTNEIHQIYEENFSKTCYFHFFKFSKKQFQLIFSLAGSQAYRILVGVGSFIHSFLPSFLHLLVFALKPYSSQDFRVIIIFLVSFDALLNLTPPLARLALYCLIFLILIFKH